MSSGRGTRTLASFRLEPQWLPSMLVGACLILQPRRALTEPATEVVIEGDRLERRSSRDSTASSSVLRREDLAQPGASTANVLLRVPGVQVQRSGAATDPATLSLRGASTAQLPVYLGPVALNDELTGAADLSLVPLFFIERIEIYRGHAPVFADRLGLAGAIVLEPRLSKGTHGFAGGMTGSYGATSLYAGAGVGSEQASSLVALQRTTAVNDYPYHDDRGTVSNHSDDRRVLRRNADAESFELWATGQYRPTPKLRLRWLVHGLERDQGVTGLSVIPARYARANTRREVSAVTTTAPCPSTTASCTFEVQTTWLRTSHNLTDPALELGYGSTRMDGNTIHLSERVRLMHELAPGWSLGWLLGGDVGTLDVVSHNDTGVRARRHSGLLGVNSSLRLHGPLSFVTLGRLAVDRTNADDSASRTDRIASGRIGLRYELDSSLTLLMNAGHYGRTPTLAELHGTSATLRGNRELRPELGYSEDLGILWRWSCGALRGQAEAIGFHQRTSDLVAWQRSSFGQIRPYNVGRARLLGAELSAALGWSDSLRIEATAGLLDPRNRTPNRPYVNDIITYRARLAGSLRLDASLPRRLKVPGLRTAGLGATWFYRSSRYSVPAGNAVLDSTLTLDLDGRLMLAVVPLALRVNLVNLFNRQNYDILGMPLPGRSYFLGAEIRWELDR